MSETILFENEQHLDRSAVASYLRTVADKLESGDDITLEAGSDSVSVAVPSSVEFEVKVEREGPANGPGELGLELELEWAEDAAEGDDGGLAIE